jgi:hypothetical protein
MSIEPFGTDILLDLIFVRIEFMLNFTHEM